MGTREPVPGQRGHDRQAAAFGGMRQDRNTPGYTAKSDQLVGEGYSILLPMLSTTCRYSKIDLLMRAHREDTPHPIGLGGPVGGGSRWGYYHPTTVMTSYYHARLLSPATTINYAMRPTIITGAATIRGCSRWDSYNQADNRSANELNFSRDGHNSALLLCIF